MLRYLIPALLVFAGCQRPTAVVDETMPVDSEPVAASAPVGTTKVVRYHQDPDHGPRVYLPHDSEPCQAGAPNVTYLAQALWRYEADSEEWKTVDFGTADNWRIACNAMVDLANILGMDLEPGTYAIAAKIDGTSEIGLIYEGPVDCNDVALGPAPEGKVALCVMSAQGAQARFVPDPENLTP